MGRTLINLIPFWWLIFLFTVLFVILGYLSARVSARFSLGPVSSDHRRYADILISILSGGFAILLAFVTINTWNYLLDVRITTAKEADNIPIILHDSANLPPDIRAKIAKTMRNYMVAVRVDEWKKMREGKESPKAWAAIGDLYTLIQAYQPQTEQEKLSYKHIVNNINELLIARRDRINSLTPIIPPPLSNSLIFVSLLLVILLGVTRGEAKFLHIMPVLFFAGIIGFNLALALSFDYPFSGDIAVQNTAFYRGILGKIPD